jgi:hypothetical protein
MVTLTQIRRDKVTGRAAILINSVIKSTAFKPQGNSGSTANPAKVPALPPQVKIIATSQKGKAKLTHNFQLAPKAGK